MSKFNSATAMARSKTDKNNQNPPSKVIIEQAIAICLKQFCFPKTYKKVRK